MEDTGTMRHTGEGIEDAGKRLFREGREYASDTALFKTISDFGLIWGFCVTKANTQKPLPKTHLSYMKVTCARYGKCRVRHRTTSLTNHQRNRGSIKCDCSFYIIANAVNGRESLDKQMKITSCCLSHSFPCQPRADQLVQNRSEPEVTRDFLKQLGYKSLRKLKQEVRFMRFVIYYAGYCQLE